MFKVSLSRRFLGLLAVMLVVVVSCWVFRQTLLQGLAEAWEVDSPLEKADAILVLGGGVDVRPFEAARLFKEGYAHQVMVAVSPLKRTAMLGLAKAHGELNREVLLHEGVPESAVITLGRDLNNTFQEARALRDWVAAHPCKSVIIPTEAIHTRRVRWVFEKVMAGSGCRVLVKSVAHPEYGPHDWWMTEAGVVAVQNEVLKYVYYRLKY
jgi:uncharacterized SAM-binding protein YcdF (DUF218 family)